MNPLLKQTQPSPKEGGSGSSTMDEQEQKLREKYGKLPPKKNVLGGMKDRKYFDSGDYAMQKAGMSPDSSSPLNVPSSHTPHTSISTGSNGNPKSGSNGSGTTNGANGNGTVTGTGLSGSGLGGGTGLGGEARGGAGAGMASGVEKELRAMEALERPTPDKLPHAQAPSLSSSPVKTSSPPPLGHHTSGSNSFPIAHHHHSTSSSGTSTPSPPGVGISTQGIARSPSGSQVFSPLGHNGANPPSSFPIKSHAHGSTGSAGVHDPPSPSAMKLSGRSMEIKPEDEEAVE